MAGWVLVICLATGSVTSAKPTKNDYEFFPPPPDEPHLQFLTAFNSEREMGRNASRSFLSYVTGQKPREKDISKPYGVASRNHKLYICDTDYGAVLVADLKTRSMTTFMAHGQGMLKVPLNMAIDADGNFYVADSGRDQVIVYDKDENCVAAIGKLDEMKPRDVVVSTDRIYIADIQNHNVHVYDRATRNPLFTIPREPDGTNLARRLYSPTNMALDSKGRLYAVSYTHLTLPTIYSV